MPKFNRSTSSTRSKTIPGQSLIPAELLKRHLAGTLPDIDRSQKYEHHYDENGEQIAQPLPLDYIEMHALAVALRKRQFEEATKKRKRDAEKFRDKIIAEYKASQVPEAKLPEVTPPSGT